LLTLKLPTARVFKPLLAPARMKGAHGGRGSGKSHFFGELTLEEALRFPGDYGVGLCQICIREVQRDLKHSAKKLIEDKLQKYGLTTGHGFKVFKDCIITPGDGVILFQGMQDYNADSIKSLESFHRSWTEEGHTLSDRSLELLRPTMRWEDVDRGGYAEMWFSWNPDSKRDAVDKMFRGGKPPTNSVCVKSNWQDNPWFPSVLETERLDCLEIEPEQYDHVWDGGYVGIRKGAYFAKQLIRAKNEKRLNLNVAADPYLPVKVICDIGGTGKKSDAFVMWVEQWVSREIRVLNYYEAVGQEFKDHLGWLRLEGYEPGDAEIILPHDGATKDRVNRVSYESAFKSAGYRVKVIPNQGTGAAAERVRELRKLLPMMWFDKKCSAGVEALSNYHEKWDDIRNVGLGPNHNWASHGADAKGLAAIAYQPPRPHGATRPKVNTRAGMRGRR